MGMFDDLTQYVPEGVAKPLVIALGALLVKNMMAPSQSASPAPNPASPAPNPAGGGLFGGLGELVSKFQNAGHGPVIDSWIANGPNKQIAPEQLGSALGPKTLSDIAARAGMSEQELLRQLAQVLPQVVDKMTPQGAPPSALPGGFGRI